MFKTISKEEWTENVFRLIGKDWMLIAAGPSEDCNAMTASWGGFGVLWGKEICWCVIRPQRYTFEFVERYPAFTLSFFDERYRDALTLCGSRSGRDFDKIGAAGLTRVPSRAPEAVTFAEAKLVFSCRKLYYQDLNPDHFLDPSLQDFYPTRDYHRMYIGEILAIDRNEP